MFNKFELTAAAFIVVCVAFGLFLLQRSVDSSSVVEPVAQSAQVPQSGIVFLLEEEDYSTTEALNEKFLAATDAQGNLIRMVIDDIKTGTGATVASGDTVLVHYAGTFETGQEFDNSRKRGQPLEFTVGAGQVIPGWEEGLIGMKVGGERILVVPPEKAYGSEGVGPIPGNATLVFKIELLEITNG